MKRNGLLLNFYSPFRQRITIPAPCYSILLDFYSPFRQRTPSPAPCYSILLDFYSPFRQRTTIPATCYSILLDFYSPFRQRTQYHSRNSMQKFVNISTSNGFLDKALPLLIVYSTLYVKLIKRWHVQSNFDKYLLEDKYLGYFTVYIRYISFYILFEIKFIVSRLNLFLFRVQHFLE